MKSYTDIEQSKKLAEFLPIESADMYYQYVLPKSDKIRYNPILGNPIDALKWYNEGYTTFGKEPITLDEYCIPCWSLAALLDLMPIINDDTYTMRGTLDNGAVISYEEVTCVMYQEKTPIDAAFEMIVWLKENKKI